MVLFVNTFIFGALGLLAFDLVVCCLDSDPAKLKKCDLLKCRNGNLNNVYMRHVAFATASNMKINFPKQNVWEKRGDSLGSSFLALTKALYRLMYQNKSQQRLGDKCFHKFGDYKIQRNISQSQFLALLLNIGRNSGRSVLSNFYFDQFYHHCTCDLQF